MAGSTFAPAIDYLVGSLRNGVTIGPPVAVATTVIPPLSTINPRVEVVDGSPATADGVWVVIGRDDWAQDGAGTGTAQYAELGGQRIEESYTLPCFIHVIADGSVQKTARDAVKALFDAIVLLVHTDPTLGGLLQQGRVSMVSRVTLDQPSTSGGTESVSALLHFDIEIHNAYRP